MTEPVIDSEATDLGTELVPLEPAHAPRTLFATDDPVEVVQQATRVADALKSVLVQQGMIQKIGQGEHVRVEGWQVLGGMLGVVPVVVWTRRVIEPAGWEAKVEARTLDGRVVGAGEAQCDRGEKRWKDSDEHALRSMAQTRATSKALAAPLRFIVKLAGFSGTPAEEMPDEARMGGTPASAAQKGRIRRDFKKLGLTKGDARAMLSRVGATDVQDPDKAIDSLFKHQASQLIETLASGPIPTTDRPSDIPEPDEHDFVEGVQ
jgi:hypothetical protein